MRKRIDGINGREVFTAVAKITAASAVMSVVCYYSYIYLTSLFASKVLTIRMLEAFVPIGLGGITFIIMSKVLGISEIDQIISTLKKKLRRA